MLNMTSAIPERCYTCPQVSSRGVRWVLRRSAAGGGVVLTWVSGCPWTPPWTRCPEAQSRLSHTPGSRALPWRRCVLTLRRSLNSAALFEAPTQGEHWRASSARLLSSADDAHRHKSQTLTAVMSKWPKKKEKKTAVKLYPLARNSDRSAFCRLKFLLSCQKWRVIPLKYPHVHTEFPLRAGGSPRPVTPCVRRLRLFSWSFLSCPPHRPSANGMPAASPRPRPPALVCGEVLVRLALLEGE